MQFDVTALESATVVFFATLLIALVLAAFVFVAAFVALLLLGVCTLIWNMVVGALKALVHGINHLWDRLVHHSSKVKLPTDINGKTGSGTGSYRPVA